MLEEAGCELAGWPLDPAEQDPLVPLRPLVVAGGLTVAVNGIVRIQAGVRGWIARREYGKVVAFLEDLCGWIARRAYGGPFWDCFPEDFQRAVVCIETGVRGWIARRRVALYRRWHALEEKEARAEAMSRLRTAAFAAARAARQAEVDKGTARRAASAANAQAAADLASASLETPARAPALHPLGERALRPGRRPGGHATAQAVAAGVHGPRGSGASGCGVGGKEAGPQQAPRRAQGWQGRP
jgi:hypothetical protein